LDPTANKNRLAYGATVTVSRVVDGDTVEISPAINGVEDVRLIGVDTPETVDPGEEVEPYGPQASAFATRELTGHRVRLGFDEERIDQDGRLLGYVYAGGSMFNEELVRKGYAQAYPYPPNTAYETKFAAAQNGARTAGPRDLGTFQWAAVQAVLSWQAWLSWWQQRGSDREQDTLGHSRTPGPAKPSFRLT
jgi:endonuclease YncB( thermonuclease family)